jgi:Uri superfamily endonuclease
MVLLSSGMRLRTLNRLVLPVDTGLYQLVIRLPRKAVIRVGAKGTHRFPAGIYVYTGSARRNLGARLERHLRREKRLRWHIDYLLERAQVVAAGVYLHEGNAECRLSQWVGGLPGASSVMRGFGSSDCHCQTHLWYFPSLPEKLFSDPRGRWIWFEGSYSMNRGGSIGSLHH